MSKNNNQSKKRLIHEAKDQHSSLVENDTLDLRKNRTPRFNKATSHHVVDLKKERARRNVVSPAKRQLTIAQFFAFIQKIVNSIRKIVIYQFTEGPKVDNFNC